ncbi:hypothetical protein FCQ88_004769 [Escherichia coli]|nr:hypothetical protein [Escherichia coli]
MRTTKPGKMPGFFVSRSRANSMTIAERLIQKGFDEGFKKGALEVARDAYFHERRSLNNFHRDRVITFEQIAE